MRPVRESLRTVCKFATVPASWCGVMRFPDGRLVELWTLRAFVWNLGPAGIVVSRCRNFSNTFLFSSGSTVSTNTLRSFGLIPSPVLA